MRIVTSLVAVTSSWSWAVVDGQVGHDVAEAVDVAAPVRRGGHGGHRRTSDVLVGQRPRGVSRAIVWPVATGLS